MICPFCQNDETKVTDKRESGDSTTRRRRECLKCGKRFTTYEKVDPVERYVIKKDGRRELFNRDKIFLGIIKACEKRDISHDQVETIVKEIEENIINNEKEIETKKIGEAIMKKLKKLDKVAYIRFASVYRDFEDIDDFKDVLNEVKS
ncbi:MAG TPA: transcriptional regulator NrdR [Candidatus Paceibacterota bacterium]|nr:transcriptional regulator NrdR [Candidatus Paceibacterota bacterium]